jgi:hypothetical protein
MTIQPLKMPEPFNWDTLGDLAQYKNINILKPNLNTYAILDQLYAEEAPIAKTKGGLQQIVGKFYKYKPLLKYEGIEGLTPVRAGTTFVGIEIELEKVNLGSPILGVWDEVEDNSLKDNGVEFVAKPIQFKYLEVELARLFSGIKSCKASQRCSVHVHINARDFTLEELKTFIALYMIFEQSLYNYSGGREDNNFCVPLRYYPKLVKEFVGMLDCGIIHPQWYKYYGFNLSPIFGGESSMIGTIEFRHMAGTTNIKHMINWINLIVSLKISAKKMSSAEIETHIKTMNTTSGYYWLAREVFKEYSGLITEQPTFKQDVELCIAGSKQVFLSNKNKDYVEIPLNNGKVV